MITHLPQSVLLDGQYLIERVRYTFSIMWHKETVSKESFSQSIIGDQHYQWMLLINQLENTM